MRSRCAYVCVPALLPPRSDQTGRQALTPNDAVFSALNPAHATVDQALSPFTIPRGGEAGVFSGRANKLVLAENQTDPLAGPTSRVSAVA